MSLNRIHRWIPVLAFSLTAGASLALTPLRILSPAPDDTVREIVPIRVPASAVPSTSPPGYIIVSIDGKFEAAVARPRTGSTVTYMWDTKAKTVKGEHGVADGKHEIKVSVAGQDGRPVGATDRVEVFVQNAVRSAPSQATLRYRFPPGVQHTYVNKINIKQSDQEVYKARIVLKRTIDDQLPGAGGMMRERIDRDSAQADQGQPVPFPGAGQSVTFNVLPQGAYIPGRKMIRTGMKPVMYLPLFPGSPVRPGQTWSAPVKLSPMYQGLVEVTVPADGAKHTLETFEWQNGVPTAKIVTKLDGTATVDNQGTRIPYKVTGERITFFDWRRGRIIKIVDDYTMAASASTGTVRISGADGSGGSTGTPAPGYNPYRPTGSYGPAGSFGPGGMAGAGGDISSLMKVMSVTQLTG